MCRATDRTLNIICAAYVSGAVATLNAFVGLGAIKPLVCASGAISTGQDIQIFDHYTQVHPEALHLQAEMILLESLMEAFPCGK